MLDGKSKLKTNVLSFYKSLTEISFDSLAPTFIKQKLKVHYLDIDDLTKHYLQRVKKHKVTK